MLCLVGSVDQVDEVLADLCWLLGFTFKSCHGVKVEPTLVDVKETFDEETYSRNEEASNYGGEDFMAEQTSEDNSDNDTDENKTRYIYNVLTLYAQDIIAYVMMSIHLVFIKMKFQILSLY